MHVRPLHFTSFAVVVLAGFLAACGSSGGGSTTPSGTGLLGQSPNGTSTTAPAGGATTVPTTVPTTFPTTGPGGVPTTAPTTVATTVPTTAPTTTPTTAPSPIALATTTANVSVGNLTTVGVNLNDGGQLVSVTSSNPAVAAIENTGTGILNVVGNAVGSTTATVTDNLGHTQLLNINVAAPAVAAPFNVATSGVGLNVGVGQIGVGATILTATDPSNPLATFTATVTPPGIVAIVQLLNNTFTVASATHGTAVITITETGSGATQVVGLTVQ